MFLHIYYFLVLIGSSSSSQPQVTSSRQPTSSVQSEQASAVRCQRAQLGTQLSQQNVVAFEDDPLTTQPDESGQMESEDISKGRGAARSIPQWGTGNILHVSFDLEWKPVKDNIDAPEAYRFHCLKVIGNRWRDWKCRLKRKWYDKYDTDEQRLAITPENIQMITEQWRTLVKYWGANDSFYRICTLANQFNQRLEEREEDEQDESFSEEIFTKVMGTDAHGHVCMYGAGVTPSQVFGQKTSQCRL
ncbi:hypothetical protein ACE6H2_012115 [Prunus campanulata]